MALTVRRSGVPWVHGLALVTAGATVLLIVAGGLVTNTGAALAVPDWPTTFGHNMFLYPWSQMVGGVFYEHTHRLMGALVGLLTVALGTVLWVTEPRAWLRVLGIGVVVLVGLQGLLGGLRVILLRDVLAVVHGCLAQAFFAAIVALAVVTSTRWAARPAPLAPGEARALLRLALVAVAALYVQIVLGALTTHAGWVEAHLGGAAVATLAVGVLAARVLALRAWRPELARPAWTLVGLVVLQVALGLGAYAARFTGLPAPGGADGGLILPVAHRAVGALLFAATVALTLEVWQLRPAGSAGDGLAADPSLVSGRVPA